MSGIYLHIPFCKQACNYCDFHFSTLLSQKGDLVNALCQEIVARHDYLENKNVSSIYLGGGTPSLLSEEEFSKIFSSLRNYFSWDKNTEVTLEANPDDIHKKSLELWLRLGINRLSIGLQSFNDEELRWMNRAHNARESLEAVELAQQAGFNNISIDLIYGSKFQTTGSWKKTLEQALALKTQHISSYNLTIENKTALGVQNIKGKEPAINDELSHEQFNIMTEVLTGAGFIHYEISNFALPGFQAVHNSNYWRQEPYLGLGPSAHSFNGTTRQWNVRNNSLYIKALSESKDFFEKEDLSVRDQYNEYVLTRLRTLWGCAESEIREKFGEDYAVSFLASAKRNKKYLKEESGVFILNKEGRSLADGITSDFFVV